MSTNWTDILERQQVRTNFWLENLKGRGDLGEIDLDGILMLWEIMRELDMSV
jgi:hypothetical protein